MNTFLLFGAKKSSSIVIVIGLKPLFHINLSHDIFIKCATTSSLEREIVSHFSFHSTDFSSLVSYDHTLYVQIFCERFLSKMEVHAI
jgi:hypothetical protein